MNGKYTWTPQNYKSMYFCSREAKYPELIDIDVLSLADQVRGLCGFPLNISSDARLDHDMQRIYGDPPWINSPHWVKGETVGTATRMCTALDLSIAMIHTLTKEEANHRLGRLWLAGLDVWQNLPNVGCELGSRHLHIDLSPEHTRPWVWMGESK